MSWAHAPSKRFGQNFIQDESVIYAILEAANFDTQDCVVEIGPGRGALTKPLLAKLNHLIVIEVDKALATYWRDYPAAHLSVMEADALTVDFSQWGKKIRLIGNLPYNISTPLLIQFLSQRETIEDLHVMLQKEVADRLIASPGCKEYGRLSVMTQAYCQVSHVLDVSPEAFYPAPKVMSSVIKIQPYSESPYPSVAFLQLERLLKMAFSMRRKTLANNLKKVCSSAQLESYGLNPQARPEEISVREYIHLAGRLACFAIPTE